MLIIFESGDKKGKSTLAKELSKELNVPYMKLKNIKIDDDIKIKDNVSISTHSQLETVTQLFERGLIKDAIFDRFHISEYVYNELFGREYDTNYIVNIEDRLSKLNDILIIRCECSEDILKERWKEEKLVDESLMFQSNTLYEEWFNHISKLETITVNTDQSIRFCIDFILGELYKRGVYKNHLKPRRQAHDETMINMAKEISKRGTCLNRQVGAVLTEDGFIIGVGYNGPPSGLNHCKTCIRRERNIPSGQNMELSRAIHAEINAIQQSGIRSRSNKDLRLFTTDSPCKSCMVSLIQIGINKIYYIHKYNDELAWQMAIEANVEMIQVEG